VRFYFGQKDKTLIRRHREDDPTNWNNGANSTFGNGGSQTPACLPPKRIIGGVCQLPT